MSDESTKLMEKYYKESREKTGEERNIVLRRMAVMVEDKPFLYDYVPREVRTDLSANNAFYAETDKITRMDREDLTGGGLGIYTKSQTNRMEMYKNLNIYRENAKEAERNKEEKEAAKRRKISQEKSDLLKPEYKKKMIGLNQKWANMYKKDILSAVMNTALSTKMVNVIREVPELYSMVPEEIKNNPGTKISKPFYDEANYFLENDKRAIKDIMMDINDPRRAPIAKLMTDTKRDHELRKDPEKAKEYAKIMKGANPFKAPTLKKSIDGILNQKETSGKMIKKEASKNKPVNDLSR